MSRARTWRYLYITFLQTPCFAFDATTQHSIYPYHVSPNPPTHAHQRASVWSTLSTREGGTVMGNPCKLNPFTSQNELSMLSAAVSVHCCDSEAFITLSVPRNRGFWSALMLLFQHIDIQVLSATLSTSATHSFHCIHAQIPEDSDLDSDDLEFLLCVLIVEELGVLPFST